MKWEDFPEDSEHGSSGQEDSSNNSIESDNEPEEKGNVNKSRSNKYAGREASSSPGPSHGKRRKRSSSHGSEEELNRSLNEMGSGDEPKKKWHAWSFGEKQKLCLAIVEQKGQGETSGNTLWETIYYKYREDFQRHTSQSMKEQFRKKLRNTLDLYLTKDQVATFSSDIASRSGRRAKKKTGSGAAYDDSTLMPMLNFIAASEPHDNPNTLTFWEKLVALKVPALQNRTGSALFQQYKLKIRHHLVVWKDIFEPQKFEIISRKCLGVGLPRKADNKAVQRQEGINIPVGNVETLSKQDKDKVAKVMSGVRLLMSFKESTNEREKFHAVTTFQILDQLIDKANQIKVEIKKKNTQAIAETPM